MHGCYVQRGQQKQARMKRKNKQARHWHRLVHRLDERAQALMLLEVCVPSCPRPHPPCSHPHLVKNDCYSGPFVRPRVVSEKTLIYSFSFCCQGYRFQPIIFPKAELHFNGKIQGEISLQAVLFSFLSSLFLKPALMLSDSLLKIFFFPSLFLVTTDLEVAALVHVFFC